MNLNNRLQNLSEQIDQKQDLQLVGTLTRVVGLTLEAEGFQAALGSKCFVYKAQKDYIEAEVIGFSRDAIFLMSTDDVQGIQPGAMVVPQSNSAGIAVGPELLGRVLDGAGQPLDDLGPIKTDAVYPISGKPINPLSRQPINKPLDVGIRAINSLFTIGQGQRIGLFAGSGVGKSVLLAMMTRYTEADIIVVGIVGERGREVKEFIEKNLGEQGLARSVVIAAPSDSSPLMRLHSAMVATTIAEYFRDQGKNVLLLIDSITRFAQAGRQIGLSIGEPPTTKGYPPSVFNRLAQLVERAGNADQGEGSITAFYTVLIESDDPNEPVADSVRSFIDGHILLSRDIAATGLYPAIDVASSISRVMESVTDQAQQTLAMQLKRYLQLYKEKIDLINIGAYQPGTDVEFDRAVTLQPLITNFLAQSTDVKVTLADSVQQLTEVLTHEQVTTAG